MAAFVQRRSRGKPVAVAASPTYCSGSRATVFNGTGGRRLPFLIYSQRALSLNDNRTQTFSISQLREAAIIARTNMSDRDSASSKIASAVIQSRIFFASKTIACYLPMPTEVDTSTIVLRSWRAKKRIFAPVTNSGGAMAFCEIRPDTPLIKNRFGLWEPATGEFISPKAIDIVITPLVAFDNQCNRIGMGGGYFDRCFAFLKHRRHWLRPKLIGVAFQCQKVEKIVPNPWDIPLCRIITEAGWNA